MPPKNKKIKLQLNIQRQKHSVSRFVVVTYIFYLSSKNRIIQEVKVNRRVSCKRSSLKNSKEGRGS